jgi:hypothetical protein
MRRHIIYNSRSYGTEFFTFILLEEPEIKTSIFNGIILMILDIIASSSCSKLSFTKILKIAKIIKSPVKKQQDSILDLRLLLLQRKQGILLTYLLTELSPSRGAANCAAPQEPPSILWNPNVQYRVHKSPPLVPILSHIHPIHSILSYLSKIHFNIVQAPASWSSQWSLSFWPSQQYPICIPLLPHSCYMPRPSHPYNT